MEDTRIPKLPKIPFIVVDAILIITALFIANSGEGPLNPFNFFWIILCVSLGGVLACLPFYVEFRNHMRLADYDKSQAHPAQSEHIEAALHILQTTGNAIAAQSERGERAAAAIEGLVRRLDERVAKLEAFAENTGGDEPQDLNDQLEQIAHVLKGDAKALQDAIRADLQTQQEKTLGDIRQQLSKFSALLENTAGLDSAVLLKPVLQRWDMIAEHLEQLKATDLPPPQEVPPAAGEPHTEEHPDATALGEAAPPEADEDLPDEEPLSPTEEAVVDDATEPPAVPESIEEIAEEENDKPTAELPSIHEEPPEEDEPTALEQPDLMEDLPEGSLKAKKSGRKQTAVIAQVLIGIGNKPYIRGEGPGLSTEKGVPMDFVEIGKWQWIADDPTQPVRCQIYKNDETPAEGGMMELEPGQKRILSPRFPA